MTSWKSDRIKELVQDTEALLEWIDSLPKDLVLPVMPGIDRDSLEDNLYYVKRLQAEGEL